MQTYRYLSLTLLAAAVAAGCSSVPNASLIDAHNSYNNARINSEVSTLAELEMKQASDTLKKADDAYAKDDDDESVTHLAYIAKQQVAIAQVTAKRKTAEVAVNNAEAKRNQVRLDARTAEADAAKRQAAASQLTVDRQATELVIAGINSERDEALIAQQEILINELNAKKTARGLVITLGDVLFRSNKAQLQSGGLRNVDKIGDFLQEYPAYKVLVEGYTDSRGSDELNQELSDRRAYAVRTALVDAGVNSDRVRTRGYGEEYPVADNDTAASRQLNRRVEIILSDEKGDIATR
ncbi:MULTISPECIES: OmpA family protein [Methylomonas]|uniref:Flagellar motor protein MotB n=3 Tax=Methylomonas TaxID=416 RepID=A0A126T9V3_9GAMM|nr:MULTISPECIES: OmpA family protein [Methylomonas]AMK78574.1 flagellar motor protein MotB [Methylomonas denitrificans]OAH98908.1 flagellar motor protein MotB [Methylomonas methanica]TCV77409.1 outer membrane protein OmpA-like peptidoglycan-associated protein [Methylomonas methanica]